MHGTLAQPAAIHYAGSERFSAESERRMPFSQRRGGAAFAVDFLVLDQFSLLPLASAMEPLRAANRVSRRPLYRWRLLSLDGRNPVSSSGVSLPVEGALRPDDVRDLLFVVAAFEPDRVGRPALPLLRRLARRPVMLGGIEMGGWVMARAGLLDGRRATVHWEELDAFAMTFPAVEAVRDRYVIDGDRLTTGGASPALDLMLAMIRAQHGRGIALDVSSVFIYDEAHAARDPQPIVSVGRLGRRDPRLIAAIRLMETHIDSTLPISSVAAQVGLSARGLQKLFVRHLDCAPAAYYAHLRLASAQRKLVQASQPILEIAAESGFRSPSAFTRAFQRHYGVTPRASRKE